MALIPVWPGRGYGRKPLRLNRRRRLLGGQNGTLEIITTSGTETVLGHFYSGDPAGHTPFGSLMQHTNGKFYGTTYEGGLLSGGTRLQP